MNILLHILFAIAAAGQFLVLLNGAVVFWHKDRKAIRANYPGYWIDANGTVLSAFVGSLAWVIFIALLLIK